MKSNAQTLRDEAWKAVYEDLGMRVPRAPKQTKCERLKCFNTYKTCGEFKESPVVPDFCMNCAHHRGCHPYPKKETSRAE